MSGGRGASGTFESTWPSVSTGSSFIFKFGGGVAGVWAILGIELTGPVSGVVGVLEIC